MLNQIDSRHANSQPQRAAHNFEEIRLRTERHSARTGETPRVLLAEFGDLKMRSARSNFAANFFGCAGFEIHKKYFPSPRAIAEFEADLIVLCSSDQDYPGLASQLVIELKAKPRRVPILVAGNPASSEQLRALDIADFIHLRCDPIATLTKWQRVLGIKG